MSKSLLESIEKKQVKICGICQNIYRLDSMPLHTAHVIPQKQYDSLERKKLPNGFVEEIEVKDYPITKDSINSYVDGADYRRDPATAIANAPKRVNLGDISEVQKFIAEDPQHAVRTLRNVTAQLEDYIKTQKTDTETKTETENQGGNE